MEVVVLGVGYVLMLLIKVVELKDIEDVWVNKGYFLKLKIEDGKKIFDFDLIFINSIIIIVCIVIVIYVVWKIVKKWKYLSLLNMFVFEFIIIIDKEGMS